MSTTYPHRYYAQAYSAPEANYGPRFDDYGPMPYRHHPVPTHPSVAPQGAVATSKGVLVMAALAVVAAGAGIGLAINLAGSSSEPTPQTVVIPDYSGNTAPNVAPPAENTIVNIPPSAPSGPVIVAPRQAAPAPAPAPNQAPAPAPAPKPQGGTPEGGTPQGGTPQGGTPQGGTPQGGTPQGGTPQGGKVITKKPPETKPEETKPAETTPKCPVGGCVTPPSHADDTVADPIPVPGAPTQLPDLGLGGLGGF